MHDFHASKDFCSAQFDTVRTSCTFSVGKKRKPGFNLSGTRFRPKNDLARGGRIDGSNSEYTEKGRNLQLLSTDRDGTFCTLFTACPNEIPKTESQEQLEATPCEITGERTGVRNGYRERELQTRIGTITPKVPKLPNQPFNTLIFDNYSRNEAALAATMADMDVNGVSTRKISRAMEVPCGTSVAKSTASDFPNEKFLLRLMGSVLIELHGRNRAGRKMFSPDIFGKKLMPQIPEKLQHSAGEQKRRLAA